MLVLARNHFSDRWGLLGSSRQVMDFAKSGALAKRVVELEEVPLEDFRAMAQHRSA